MLSLNGWLVVGFLGQLLFTARFVVQWLVSEKKRNSVVPVAFWWFSLFGGLALLSYAVSRRDPVIIFGQTMGLVVYVRNLMLVAKAERRGRLRHQADCQSTPAINPAIERSSSRSGQCKLIPPPADLVARTLIRCGMVKGGEPDDGNIENAAIGKRDPHHHLIELD
jgi:lipid-A-disaccharide synthase-like uncharacterized protein